MDHYHYHNLLEAIQMLLLYKLAQLPLLAQATIYLSFHTYSYFAQSEWYLYLLTYNQQLASKAFSFH